MTPSHFPRTDPAAVRAARANRVRMIRRRVVGGSVALFIAVWSLIAVRLVTGHDPVLARAAAARTLTRTTAGSPSTATSASSAASTSTAATTSTAPATSSATGGSASSTPSPVTSAAS
jgi:hypothetical protein